MRSLNPDSSTAPRKATQGFESQKSSTEETTSVAICDLVCVCVCDMFGARGGSCITVQVPPASALTVG